MAPNERRTDKGVNGQLNRVYSAIAHLVVVIFVVLSLLFARIHLRYAVEITDTKPIRRAHSIRSYGVFSGSTNGA